MLLLVQPFPPEGGKKKKKNKPGHLELSLLLAKPLFAIAAGGEDWQRAGKERCPVVLWRPQGLVITCRAMRGPGRNTLQPPPGSTCSAAEAPSCFPPHRPGRITVRRGPRGQSTRCSRQKPPPHPHPHKTGTHSSQGPPTRAAPRQPCVPFRAQFASVRVPESTHLKVSFLPQHLLILSTEIKKAPKKKKSTRAGNFMLRLPQQQFHGPTCGINHSIPNASKASQGRERLPCVMT